MRSRHLALAVALMVVAGCRSDPAGQGPGADQPFPRRRGPAVEVARGTQGAYGWRLVAQDSEIGLCLEMGRMDGSGGADLGCGFEVPEKHMVRFFAHAGMAAGAEHRFFAGLVARDVVMVRVELREAEPVDVEPIGLNAGFEVNFFVAPVPGDAMPLSVVALGPGGQELDRQAGPADPFGA
jgi:hypothetical protein